MIAIDCLRDNTIIIQFINWFKDLIFILRVLNICSENVWNFLLFINFELNSDQLFSGCEEKQHFIWKSNHW